MQTRHHEGQDRAQPLDREQRGGAYAGPRVYGEQMALVELAVLGFTRLLVHVHGVQPQRGHNVRERVQHNVRQRDARLFAFSDHENGCKTVGHAVIVPILLFHGLQ